MSLPPQGQTAGMPEIEGAHPGGSINAESCTKINCTTVASLQKKRGHVFVYSTYN